MRFLKTHFGEGRAASPPSADLPLLAPPGMASGVAKDLRLEVALWGADLGLWETDFSTDITHWYDDWCERIDLDPCEGKDHAARWDAYVHPEDRATVTARLGAHLIGADPAYTAEYRIRDRKGRWQWLFERGRVVERAPDGSPLRMMGVCREIGARKQAEEALRLSEFRYRSVASMTPGYIFEYRFAPDGGIHQFWVSDGVQALFGVTREEFLRQGGHDPFVDPEWVNVIRERRAAVARGEPRSGEMKVRTVTGQSKWLQASAVPVRDPRTGGVIGALGSCYDITESRVLRDSWSAISAVLLSVMS